MGKSLDFAQGVGVTVFGAEHNFRKDGGGSATLAGDSEFFFEIVADIGNGAQDKFVVVHKSIIAVFSGVCQAKKRFWNFAYG